MSNLLEEIGPEGKEAYVKEMFDTIAGNYDLMNLVMTAGMLRFWHRAFLKVTGLLPGSHHLDVACGTGDLTQLTALQVGPSGRVTGLDFSPEMLAVAAKRVAGSALGSQITWVQGNAMAMPFADDTFDGASIGFALRNVKSIRETLAEMTRVVRPGSHVVSLEISKPTNPAWRALFFLYFYNVVPFIDRFIMSSRVGRVRPYTYLPHSLTKFPEQQELAAIFREAGLRDVRVIPLSGGMVCLHVGTKP
ncbi:MAG: bifunctional demethylmenaquinone methyltransferase/2-methoxy-6-polyprenyl-1,4-benzoquinol methylase UbiE [Symbiobacteriia bacterium]